MVNVMCTLKKCLCLDLFVIVKGFSKRKSFFQWLKVNTADITLLQEMFITVENEKRIKRDWDGFMINCCSDSAHSRGVSILINKNLNFESLYEYKSEDGRIVILSIKYQNEVYTFCNIYALIEAMKK